MKILTLSSEGVLVNNCEFLMVADISFRAACLRAVDDSVLVCKVLELDETEPSCERNGKVDSMLRLPLKDRKPGKT